MRGGQERVDTFRARMEAKENTAVTPSAGSTPGPAFICELGSTPHFKRSRFPPLSPVGFLSHADESVLICPGFDRFACVSSLFPVTTIVTL